MTEENTKDLKIDKINTDNREFLLNMSITAENVEKVILGIRAINFVDDKESENKIKYDRRPIKLIIDSYGGDCYSGMALVNIIDTSKTPVHTYCYGKAMSMGLTIFNAGHKRFAHKYSTFMQHQLSTVEIGKLTDIVQSTNESIRLQDMMDELLIKKTKITKAKLLDLRERKIDWYFTGEEALELGLVDELIN